MRFWISIVVISIVVFGCGKNQKESVEPQGKQSVEDVEELYEGFIKDRTNLRDTYLIEDQNIQASSDKANEAALRIFSKIKFIGMPKEKVLRLLGDPATISDYGVKAGSGIDDPLIYKFDGGYNGNQWTLQFQNGNVIEVKHDGIY